MSKTLRFTLMLVVLVAVLGMVVHTTMAKPAWRPHRYETYMAECTQDLTEEWVDAKGVYHFRAVGKGWLFGDPYLAGAFENHKTVALNFDTGEGYARGSVKIMPDAYDGTWEGGSYYGRIHDYVFKGRGVEYGTGELEGLADLVHIQQINSSELPAGFENPCGEGDVLGAFFARGIIVNR